LLVFIRKTPVGTFDQVTVELCLHLGTQPRFVSGHQQDRLSGRIEGKGHAPDPATGSKAHFLHVGVTRTLQRVDGRPTEGRSDFREHTRRFEQVVLDPFLERSELRLELGMKQDDPRHEGI
jgi:hypothetical protein